MNSKKRTASSPAKENTALDSTDSRLDEALEESFPASDPIAVHDPEPQHVAQSDLRSSGKNQR